MTDVHLIAPIVEGHGEIKALPILLQRIAKDCGAAGALRINNPIRVKSGSFLNVPAEFARHVALAAAKAAQSKGSVLIVLDCDQDGDCPATLGPSLLARARTVRSDVDYLVALADKEFETWFIASSISLRGICGLPPDLTAPANFESIRDAKGWLGRRMATTYDPIRHQHLMAGAMDIGEARSSRSFDRLYQRIRQKLT